MERILSSIVLSALCLTTMANRPDSVYVKSYNVGNGLRMSYSVDKHQWTPVGKDFNLLQCDYGAWGAEKKMASVPSVLRDNNGEWFAVWALNDRVNQFAISRTRDLSCWMPQDYPYMTTTDENVINPVLTKENGLFCVTYSTQKGNIYKVTSKDFLHWSEAVKINVASSWNDNIARTSWDEIATLITKSEAAAYRAGRDNKGMGDDSRVFGKLNGLKASLKADLSDSKSISPDLFGIFFEDINYAADGGLYAELLQNRDFEYSSKDRREWTSQTAWDVRPVSTMTRERGINWTIETDSPLHPNNKNYSRLDTRIVGSALVNGGYDGIPVKKGEKYDFSVFLRTSEKASQKLRVSLLDGEKTLASVVVTAGKNAWKQVKAVLVPNAECGNASLAIEPLSVGVVDVDFASLFPQQTFKNRKNGLRRDLAQTLADMHPRFVRFPGGCASHGNGIDNIYHWKATIGPLWERQHDWNIWHYHQSRGLGFYEYFQFCEDIGAEPLPVLAAGVPCQNSSVGGNGQQGGLKWGGEMEAYLQELLDLIEWANGDAKTSKLAKMRADAGHKAPFGLKYLGIGNEDLFSQVFVERYLWLIKEIKKVHPEITIVGTVGPFWEGSDYEYGWQLARENNIEIVDEHYYNNVGWYLNHQDFYDKYDRKGTKVYLGEWASRGNRWENALAEAIHVTNLERNADVVVMSSYAPLLAREGNTQWNPDLIYFNNTEVKPTPNYYVQMLSGQNNGVEFIFSDLSLSDNLAQDRVKASIVRADNGDVIIKLVNALPMETSLSLDLGNLSAFSSSATVQQIDAPHDARNVSLGEAKTISTSELSSMKLPRYSFTVVRLKAGSGLK
ncbi:MAG: alpha-L-arabinofuranosidase [Prevotella sp.]|nr:alpha-L-arabinofuranosidase [Prevotella sp.]